MLESEKTSTFGSAINLLFGVRPIILHLRMAFFSGKKVRAGEDGLELMIFRPFWVRETFIMNLIKVKNLLPRKMQMRGAWVA